MALLAPNPFDVNDQEVFKQPINQFLNSSEVVSVYPYSWVIFFSNHGNYLARHREQIGSEVPWVFSSGEVLANFTETGDWMKSSVPDLQKAINADVSSQSCMTFF